MRKMALALCLLAGFICARRTLASTHRREDVAGVRTANESPLRRELSVLADRMRVQVERRRREEIGDLYSYLAATAEKRGAGDRAPRHLPPFLVRQGLAWLHRIRRRRQRNPLESPLSTISEVLRAKMKQDDFSETMANRNRLQQLGRK